MRNLFDLFASFKLNTIFRFAVWCFSNELNKRRVKSKLIRSVENSNWIWGCAMSDVELSDADVSF